MLSLRLYVQTRPEGLNQQENDKHDFYGLINIGYHIWVVTGDQVPQDDGESCIRNQYPASYTLNVPQSWQVERCDQDNVANKVENEQERKRAFPPYHQVPDAKVEVDQCCYDSKQDDRDLQ